MVFLDGEQQESKTPAMDWDTRIRQFVDSLVSAEVPAPYRNPYGQPHAAHNLLQFLSRRDRLAKTVLLVGEAPGHRGAAISGVPFTSADILSESWGDPWGAFGPQGGYQIPEQPRHRTEATATMVWQGLSGTCAHLPLPLTWNAVPFHPAGSTSNSNSPVKSAHLPLGEPFLEWLLEFAPNAVVVGVGRSAQRALALLGHEAIGVRHPSRGGKAAFLQGVAAAANDLCRVDHRSC